MGGVERLVQNRALLLQGGEVAGQRLVLSRVVARLPCRTRRKRRPLGSRRFVVAVDEERGCRSGCEQQDGRSSLRGNGFAGPRLDFLGNLDVDRVGIALGQRLQPREGERTRQSRRVESARAHGARWLPPHDAARSVDFVVQVEFRGERHEPRVLNDAAHANIDRQALGGLFDHLVGIRTHFLLKASRSDARSRDRDHFRAGVLDLPLGVLERIRPDGVQHGQPTIARGIGRHDEIEARLARVQRQVLADLIPQGQQRLGLRHVRHADRLDEARAPRKGENDAFARNRRPGIGDAGERLDTPG